MQETSDAEWVSLQGLAWLMESSLQAAELLRDSLWELFSFRSHKSKTNWAFFAIHVICSNANSVILKFRLSNWTSYSWMRRAFPVKS